MPQDKAPEPLRILLVDDHPAVRRGLALVLEADGLGSCREASSCAEALRMAQGESPDAAIVELSMSDQDSFSMIAELRAMRIPVLVCSLHEDPAHVKQALAAGAQGYITKPDAPLAVAQAVRAVLEGWLLISARAPEGLDEEPREYFAPVRPKEPPRT